VKAPGGVPRAPPEHFSATHVTHTPIALEHHRPVRVAARFDVAPELGAVRPLHAALLQLTCTQTQLQLRYKADRREYITIKINEHIRNAANFCGLALSRVVTLCSACFMSASPISRHARSACSTTK
jgi:hypothetical protein